MLVSAVSLREVSPNIFLHLSNRPSNKGFQGWACTSFADLDGAIANIGTATSIQ